jgi:hypothetical protein
MLSCSSSDTPLAGWLAVTSSSTGEKRAQAWDESGRQRDVVLVFEKRMKVGCRRRHDVPVGPFAGGFRKGALQDWAG